MLKPARDIELLFIFSVAISKMMEKICIEL